MQHQTSCPTKLSDQQQPQVQGHSPVDIKRNMQCKYVDRLQQSLQAGRPTRDSQRLYQRLLGGWDESINQLHIRSNQLLLVLCSPLPSHLMAC